MEVKNYFTDMLYTAYFFTVFQHKSPSVLVSSLSAVCGDDLPGDSCHVPRYHQCDDVPYGEPRPAYRGTSQDTGPGFNLFYFEY